LRPAAQDGFHPFSFCRQPCHISLRLTDNGSKAVQDVDVSQFPAAVIFHGFCCWMTCKKSSNITIRAIASKMAVTRLNNIIAVLERAPGISAVFVPCMTRIRTHFICTDLFCAILRIFRLLPTRERISDVSRHRRRAASFGLFCRIPIPGRLLEEPRTKPAD